MPRLSWNEIEQRASAFATRWAGETYEKGERQRFWGEVPDVFGIDRLYPRKAFATDADRVARLFTCYQALTAAG